MKTTSHAAHHAMMALSQRQKRKNEQKKAGTMPDRASGDAEEYVQRQVSIARCVRVICAEAVWASRKKAGYR